MASVINTNVASLNSQRYLTSSQNALATSLQRLSSGLRINSAKDDAAGLAISERMSSQIRGLNQAVRNANDAISLSQTAEGALTTVGDALQRMRELAVQSVNDTNSSSDRQALQQEVSQLQQEINRVANTTQFNGKNLLDGSFAGEKFQVGANSNQTIDMSLSNARATNLGNNTITMTGWLDGAGAATGKSINSNNGTDTLTISGSLGTKIYSPTAGESGHDIARDVNAMSAQTGVTASVKTVSELFGLSNAGTVSFKLYGLNQSSPVTISASVGSTGDLSTIASAINNYAGTTGITATVNGGSVTMTSEEGYDIDIVDFTNSAGGTIQQNGKNAFTGLNSSASATTLTSGGPQDSTYQGATIKFNSTSAFSIHSSGSGGLFNTVNNASTLSSVASVDIGTSLGATSAIDVIDAALQSVLSQRASLGAVQNRLTAAVTNLQTSSENISASRSRVQDADYASETANMTRNQILQQAGTAMLAQANSMPQSVLSLLK